MATQPNILVFMTDQQRWDSLGCYGVPGVHTPNLDRLAGQGVRYDACYVNNPICSPSRASFWTGKHLPGHGCFNNQDCLPLEEVSFAERLATAGYDTALIGKLHLQQQHREAEHRHPRDGFRVYEWCMAPFTHFAPVNAYQSWLADRDPAYLARLSEDRAMVGDTPVSAHQTTWAAERCNEFLTAGRDRSKPFFLCCSVFDPHNPYWNHPSEIEQLLDIDRLPAPVAADESFDQRTDALQRYGVHGYMHDYLRRYVAKYGAAPYPEIMRRWRTGYHAAVALIDQQIGRVLGCLEESGLAQDTIVVFTSDHGDMIGDHGIWAKGPFFYEACARVPLIIRRPGTVVDRSAGESVAAPCQLHDLAATCLLEAGVDPEQVRSWMPDGINVLDVGALRRRGYAASMHMGRDTLSANGYDGEPMLGTMWRQDRWKLNLWRRSGAADAAQGELYDLQRDPDEMNNLWDDPDHRSVRDDLSGRTGAWLLRQTYQARRGAAE